MEHEVINIIETLKKEMFYIYGAGGHGKKFLKSVEKLGLINNFIGFTVTLSDDMEENVLEIDKVSRENLIVIAAHDRNARIMENNLIKLGFKNYINIYKNMTELYWGEPDEKSVMVSTDALVRRTKKINYLCALYAAIEYHNGNNLEGKNIYLKTLGLSSDVQTAKSRWENFETRIDRYRDIREPENFEIKIDYDKGLILDGSHRLILAKYYDIKLILADIFHIDPNEYESYYRDNIYGECFFNNFNGKEKKLLIDIKKELVGSI